MKTFLDCYPCFLRQALECARISGIDTNGQKRVMDKVMKILLSMDYNFSPPYIARFVYMAIKEISGINDPYLEIRSMDNRKILKIYPQLYSQVLSSSNPILNACILAAGGNLMDSGVGKRKGFHIKKNIEKTFNRTIAINDFNDLRKDLEKAKLLLYLGDNSGEIVLDKLLIEVIKKYFLELKIIYVVRGGPVINDVVMEDARQVGMDKICEVVSNGDIAPGTIMEFCSYEFKKLYKKADLIIAKGQGNYESLSYSDIKRIYFILIAKCPVIANHLNVGLGSVVIKKGYIKGG